jgi:hypothetical protein
MPDLLQELLQDVTLEPRDPALRSVAELEDAFGMSLSSAVLAYFSAHQTHHLGSSGALYCSDEPCFPAVGSPRGNLFAQVLRERPELIAAFTGSMVLGSDGGGQGYFVDLSPGGDAVAIYGPGVGELRPLTDSLESFAGLVRLDALWAEYAEANDIDTGAVIDGDREVDLSKPDLTPLAKLLSTLQGRLHLPGYDGTEVCSDFDEIVGALAGSPLRLPTPPRFVEAHERAYPLVCMLDHGGLFPLGTYDPPDDWQSSYPDTIYWLWRSYFQEDDERLETTLRRCSDHRARLIRDAGALIASLVQSTDELPEWNHLRVLRQLVLAPPPRATEPPPGYEELLAEDGNDDSTRARLKEMLRGQPTHADAWDNLTFQFYSAAQWPQMQRCAEISAALRPEHYYPWMQLGVARMTQGHLAESLPFFDRALCLSSNPNLWLNKAGAWLELGRRDVAVATLRQLPEHNRADLIAQVDDLAPLAEEVEATGP